jgi:hypothetical protein
MPDNTSPPTTPIDAAADTSYWGHSLTLRKPLHIMRFILQNPYGLDAKNNYRKLDYIARNAAIYQVDVTCLPETNADWKQSSIRASCNALLRRHFKHHRLITSSSTAAALHAYLPGGTATLVTNGFTGRIANSGSDPRGLGRWTYVRIKGKSNARILVVTIYQVCKTTIQAAGDSTAFSQQWNLLRASGQDRPNPRAQFSQDLSDFLSEFPNDPIILAGDINSWLQNPNDDKNFANLVLRYNLKDLLIRQHGPESEIPTRKAGRRIDYIFASELIADNTTRCGALQYDRMVDSDHRALFVDIDIDHILGGRPPALSSPALRGIDSTDSEHCSIYIQLLLKYLTDHKVYDRVEALKRWTTTHGLTQRLKQKWEAVDRDMTAGCLYAENEVRSQDRPAWSLKLHQAHLSVVYLRIYIKALTLGHDPHRAVLPFLLSEESYDPPEVDDLPAAYTLLKDAKATLKDIRKNAKAHRESFLEARAAAAAIAQDITVEKAINMILQREGTKRAFQTLRRYLRPGANNSLTEVHVQNTDGTTTVIDEPNEMYDRIIARDLQHYHQAEGTPCTQAPIREWLGTAGDTPICNSWLDGEDVPILPDHHYPETQILFDQIPCTTRPNPVSATVSIEDYKEFFGKWKESTSTSQDRHLGHWKALISHTAQNQFPDESTLIIGIIVDQLNLALKHGYAWQRWQRIVSTKIPKAAGNMLLNKLRTITLFEPDFNWTQGLVIGRRMIKSAEISDGLHDNQWGTRPGRHALGAVSLKVMSYEIARLTRTPLGSFDMDAASCFDRIIINFAMLLCRRQGVPANTCLMAALVLLQADYFVKTAHGISPNSYSSTASHRTHGPGQGSRIGPALWVLISCLMFKAMDSLCHGAEFCDPTQAFSHQRTGDGFVDDVANIFNFGLAAMITAKYSEQMIAQGMQAEAQTWERLLNSTGGALELSKCFFYVMSWKFKNDGTPMLLTPDEMPDIEIQLTSGPSATLHTITHKSTYDAHKTLGVKPNPSGDTNDCFTTQLPRANRISEGVRLNKMERNEALMGYRHIWLPSVGYPLACWPLCEDDLYQIEKNSINAFLPKMGFCRTTARAIIFGSKKFGGFGLTRLRDFQGVNQISLFLQHIRLYDSIGVMYHIGYCWYQLYCGTSFAALSNPSFDLPHQPAGWFTRLRIFLAAANLSIDLPPALLRIPTPLRRGDSNLMEAFCGLNWTPRKLELLNYCRLFLQVEFLSELCSAEGNTLLAPAWQGHALPSHSTLLWPNQARPSGWTLWRQALAELFLLDPAHKLRNPRDLPLRTRLGRWHPSHSAHRLWPSYQSAVHLFRRHNSGFTAHLDTLEGRLPSRIFSAIPCGRQTCPQATLGTVPCDPGPLRRERYSALVPVGFFHQPPAHPAPNSPTQLLAHLHQLDAWESCLFPYVQAYSDVLTLKRHLEDPLASYLCIAHDGGATDRGSFAWCIATTTTVLWEGSGHTEGHTPGSFRAESYGMLAPLRFLLHYLSFFNVTLANPDLIHKEFTDSKSLLDRLQSSKDRFYASPKACLASDYDLEAAITQTIVDLPLHLSQLHVKSHQDKDQPDTLKLPWKVQLNVLCDRLASRQLEVCPLVTRVSQNPYCNAYLAHGPLTVSGQLRKSMFCAASQPIIRTYLLDRHQWTTATFDSIA